MLLVENHIMSKHNKRRSNNEKVTSQKWFVITLQETKDHDEDNRKKENKEDTKEIYWINSLRNHKYVDSSKKFNHVSSQAWKWKHYTSCSEFRSLNKFRKISNISKKNHELDAYNASNLCCASIWNIHHNKHK